MKQKKARSSKKNSNYSVESKFKKKENNESFKIIDISKSSTYKYNLRPISFIFKKEPIIVKLVESIESLQELNSNELNYYEEKNYDKTLIENIVNCFKLIKALNNFLEYNKIDENTLYLLAPVIKFHQIEENVYIWKEGDKSTNFYFLLRGKLSIRKKTNSGEKEKFILNENNIFGLLDIMYERKRRMSCVSLTESYYLSIDKEFFKKYMEEKVNKAEIEKKSFLMKFFNNFLTISKIKLERFISNNVEVLIFGKNDIIYKEGETNKCLYIIYNGEANLMKNINQEEFMILSKFNQSIENIQEKAKNIDYESVLKDEENNDNKNININNDKKSQYLELLLDKANYKTISTLSRGCIGGLEICTGLTKFKYTLVSSSDFCSVIKVDIKNLEDEFLRMLMINLLPVFIQSEKKIHKQIENIKFIDNNIIPPSCRKYKNISNLIRLINNHRDDNKPTKLQRYNYYYFKTTENKKLKNFNINISMEDNDNDKTYKKIIRKIDNGFDTNEGGFIKVNNYNVNLNRQKCVLKEKLRRSKKHDYMADNILRICENESLGDLKYSSVKMKHLLTEENSNNKENSTKKKSFTTTNFYESMLSKKNSYINNSDENNKLMNKLSFKKFKRWNFIKLKKPKINKHLFNMTIKNKNSRRLQSSKITEKYYKQINEIFEEYYKKKFLKKSYQKKEFDDDDDDDHKLIAVQLISKNGEKKFKEINSFDKKKNNLVKEIIVMKEPSLKEEGMNTFAHNSYDKNTTFEKVNTLVSNYTEKAKNTGFDSINEYNIYRHNFENRKNDEKLVKIVNNKYIRDLFYINRSNDNNNYSIYNKNKLKNERNTFFTEMKEKNGKYIKNRMIFYDTGHFDMPLVSNFPISSKKID